MMLLGTLSLIVVQKTEIVSIVHILFSSKSKQNKTKQTQSFCLLTKEQIHTKEHLPTQYCPSRDLTFSIEKKQKYLLFSAFKSDLDVPGMCWYVELFLES